MRPWGQAGIPLPAEGPQADRARQGSFLELIMISAENFHCCTLPVAFLAQGPKLGLFLIHMLKEQINSSKLWQMGIL